MTIHWLYQGGGNSQNPNFGYFPAAVPTPTQTIQAASHRAPVQFCLQSELNFGAEGGPLLQYIADNTTGALLETPGSLNQDVLMVLLPPKHFLQHVYYRVVTAGPAGLTFDLRRVLIATPPTEPTLIGSAIATGLAGDAISSLSYQPNALITAPQGIVLRINEVEASGMGNFHVIVSATVSRFETGY